MPKPQVYRIPVISEGFNRNFSQLQKTLELNMNKFVFFLNFTSRVKNEDLNTFIMDIIVFLLSVIYN